MRCYAIKRTLLASMRWLTLIVLTAVMISCAQNDLDRLRFSHEKRLVEVPLNMEFRVRSTRTIPEVILIPLTTDVLKQSCLFEVKCPGLRSSQTNWVKEGVSFEVFDCLSGRRMQLERVSESTVTVALFDAIDPPQ